MKLNEKILDLRKSKGMSQEDLANKINVSRQSVSKWELGETMPEINKIIEIANLFQVSTDYLLIDGNQKKDEKEYKIENLKDYFFLSIGILLLVVSLLTSVLIESPDYIPSQSHGGIIGYIFQDWTLWGIVWRFVFFIPSIILIGYFTFKKIRRNRK